MKKYTPWLKYVGLAFLAGAIGSFFTMPAIGSWYADLVKPTFSPPNWVFGPVWTTLYFLMGTSIYLISEKSKKGKKKSKKNNVAIDSPNIIIVFYYIQLILNTLWSVVFFGFRAPDKALVIILMLLAFIVVITKRAYRYSKVASIMFIPYVLWVCFATVLNIAIVWLN